MSSKYSGFRPQGLIPPTTLKPGESDVGRNTKFQQAGAHAARAPVRARAWTSTTRSSETVRVGDYRTPDRRGVMADKEDTARARPPKPFVASSTSAATFPDFIGDSLRLQGRTVEDYREAFVRADADGSGRIDIREVRLMLAMSYGQPAPEREVQLFVAQFDKNADGYITWDEFQAALPKVQAVMKEQVTTRVEKPKFMATRKQKVVTNPAMKSSYQIDMGESGTDPRTRKLMDGNGMNGTCADMYLGTCKGSNHIPGYRGFVPGSANNETVLKQGMGGYSRDSESNKVNHVDTYRHNVPGYQGHAPLDPSNDHGPISTSHLTTSGAAFTGE